MKLNCNSLSYDARLHNNNKKKRAQSFTSFDDKLQSSCNYFELLGYAHSCAMPEIVVIIIQLPRLCLHQWALACRSVFHSIQFCLPSSSVRIRVNSKASFLNHLRDFFSFFFYFRFRLCKVKSLFALCCCWWRAERARLTSESRPISERVRETPSWKRRKNSRGFTLLIFFLLLFLRPSGICIISHFVVYECHLSRNGTSAPPDRISSTGPDRVERSKRNSHFHAFVST